MDRSLDLAGIGRFGVALLTLGTGLSKPRFNGDLATRSGRTLPLNMLLPYLPQSACMIFSRLPVTAMIENDLSPSSSVIPLTGVMIMMLIFMIYLLFILIHIY